MDGRVYVAIDLKSFYASVECVVRGLDPLTANLVVADPSRTEKTICLAVSPSLKSYGIPGRARLFEVVQRVREINAQRSRLYRGELRKGIFDNTAIQADRSLALDFITAPPRMREYMKVSTEIYSIYLKYISREDIQVYSIDEVFMDVTDYLQSYGCSAHELTLRIIRDVLATTGITATAGIGSNLYLAKIAMDIEAKHSPADKDGVRIAELDEMTYRRKYWDYTPLTDFWRVGRGTAERLGTYGMRTMGDVARMSVLNEEVLYRLFGVNAELLIDHAWGWEPCTIKDIKSYKPSSRSISVGQVLSEPYTFEKARVVVREMADSLALDLVDKGMVCDQMVVTVGYDNSCPEGYIGEFAVDHYGRKVPKPVHGSRNLTRFTSSSVDILDAVTTLFDRLVDRRLLVRRMYVVANHIIPKDSPEALQLTLFDSHPEEDDKERRRQETILAIKKKFGKNAILKGINFEEGATQKVRNGQVGGHKA
ncbi:MAG: DNA methylase [Candidatus Cryptobacteroides sp.]